MKLIWVCLFALGIATIAEAHSGDPIVPIFEISDQDLVRIDLHDSSVWDWQTILGPPTLTRHFFQVSDLGIESDLDSFDFNIWIAWHATSDRIYVAMEQIDDVYINRFDRDVVGSFNSAFWYHDSAINFMIDGDHSGDPNGEELFFPNVPQEEELLLNNSHAQWYIGIGETFDEGPNVHLMENGPRYFTDWFLTPPFSEGGGGASSELSGATVTEFYITPFDQLNVTDRTLSIPSALYPDKVIGIGIHIRDYDEEDGPFTSLFHIPIHQWGHGLSPHQFMDGLLIRTRDTVINDMSWSRIKASLK